MTTFDEFREHMPYDLAGVTPPDTFADLPPAENPLNLFPDARSAVVLGKRIERGHFRTIEEGTGWVTPNRWLTDLDHAVRWIEAQGFECVPFLPLNAPRMPRRPVRAGRCAPQAIRPSLELAAVAAGLGVIGYHGMFMSARYGIRQQLGLLVTDMAIEPGPGPSDARICDGGECLACVKECPLQAISAEAAVTLERGGRRMRIGRINAPACHVCPNGTAGDTPFFTGAEELELNVGAHNRIRGDTVSRFSGGGLPNRLAAACGRACIAHFEATHETEYRTPFRHREPWGFRPDRRKEA
ncbi:MAG: hypothetical protein JW951_01965 [Lentisphaerae bacterium]|nr:hypothetical protein [Lentisphaerota bacterium]